MKQKKESKILNIYVILFLCQIWNNNHKKQWLIGSTATYFGRGDFERLVDKEFVKQKTFCMYKTTSRKLPQTHCKTKQQQQCENNYIQQQHQQKRGTPIKTQKGGLKKRP